MPHVHGTGHRGLTAIAVAVLLLGGLASAHAALTTESCLAKKLKEWGKLRNCQAKENGKALQGKEADPAKCQTKFDEKLAKLTAQATEAAIACRYGVNGDGTATDYDTGLVWEQKTDDGSVHDKDNFYTWCVGVSPNPNCTNPANPPDGTAFTAFLGTLNNGTSVEGSTTSGCFAEHCDWRLPAIGELVGIVDLAVPGCGVVPFTTPCIDQTVFGPTAADYYWSASTDRDFPFSAWLAGFFFDGNPILYDVAKYMNYNVRGVRSGL